MTNNFDTYDDVNFKMLPTILVDVRLEISFIFTLSLAYNT